MAEEKIEKLIVSSLPKNQEFLSSFLEVLDAYRATGKETLTLNQEEVRNLGTFLEVQMQLLSVIKDILADEKDRHG